MGEECGCGMCTKCMRKTIDRLTDRAEKAEAEVERLRALCAGVADVIREKHFALSVLLLDETNKHLEGNT